MTKYKTYISYVIQKGDNHRHEFEIVDLPLPKYSFYMDNTAQQVVKWVESKQREFGADEMVIILNFFNVSNVK